MLKEEYLYHCRSCEKPDKEYPNKEIECNECKGAGGDCWKCEGYGEYLPRTSVKYHMWARNDAYGIYTGLFCDKCYDNPHKYTYKKDRYFDESYCGERLEEDY